MTLFRARVYQLRRWLDRLYYDVNSSFLSLEAGEHYGLKIEVSEPCVLVVTL